MKGLKGFALAGLLALTGGVSACRPCAPRVEEAKAWIRYFRSLPTGKGFPPELEMFGSTGQDERWWSERSETLVGKDDLKTFCVHGCYLVTVAPNVIPCEGLGCTERAVTDAITPKTRACVERYEPKAIVIHPACFEARAKVRDGTVVLVDPTLHSVSS